MGCRDPAGVELSRREGWNCTLSGEWGCAPLRLVQGFPISSVVLNVLRRGPAL